MGSPALGRPTDHTGQPGRPGTGLGRPWHVGCRGRGSHCTGRGSGRSWSQGVHCPPHLPPPSCHWAPAPWVLNQLWSQPGQDQPGPAESPSLQATVWALRLISTHSLLLALNLISPPPSLWTLRLLSPPSSLSLCCSGPRALWALGQGSTCYHIVTNIIDSLK